MVKIYGTEATRSLLKIHQPQSFMNGQLLELRGLFRHIPSLSLKMTHSGPVSQLLQVSAVGIFHFMSYVDNFGD